MIDDGLGEILGEEYVKKYFSEESKLRLDEMIRYFKQTLNDMIRESDWMEDETKTKALEKLESIKWKIGYPVKYEDMSNLKLNYDYTFLGSVAKISEWWYYRNGKELFKNVDLDKWEMYPHQVNAYYHPLLNEIVFPAAILQNPFFDMEKNDNFNYGGIGVVIAHEITHGFDDQGKRFDAEGNMVNWWTENDERKFQEEASKLVKQFDELEIYDMKLNGKLTLGENLADLGGVRISLEALRRKKLKEGLELSVEDKKEFFESFARIWANLCRKEEGQKLVKTDPHSPGLYRVNGILPHVKEFMECYCITKDNEMYLEEDCRCKLWSV